jgi:hypothetical protein
MQVGRIIDVLQEKTCGLFDPVKISETFFEKFEFRENRQKSKG